VGSGWISDVDDDDDDDVIVFVDTATAAVNL